MTNTEKVKVELVNTPHIQGDYRHPIFPPLGLAYLAAVLEQHNFEVKITDCPANHFTHAELKNDLVSFKPDIVGIASMTTTIPSVLESARIAKQVLPNCKVVLGGPHATFMDKQILAEEKAVDVVVRGEGEYTMLELAQTAAEPESLPKIAGIAYRNNGDIAQTPNRPPIADLDVLPRPAYHLLSMDKYRIYGRRILPLMSSRGCPHQCTFCVASQMFGVKFRGRTARNVVDEIEWLRHEYGAEGISFQDDALTYDRKRILEICNQMIDRKLQLPWGCQTRVDRVDEEVLSKMAQSGCDEISFGVESGSQEILDSVHKRVTIGQAEKAISMAKNAKMFVIISTILGYPGETKESLKQTVKFMQRLEVDDAWLCIATPYPGTELRSLVERQGWEMEDDWTKYNTMNTIFTDPAIPASEYVKIRETFYDSFYTPKYILRQIRKGYFGGNFYSKIMARTAANFLIWRVKKLVIGR
jgi:anaerobic magnesium-protoporphyrin IX monomethyl ester cyclase